MKMKAVADSLGATLAIAALSSTGCASPQPVTTAEAACAVATARVTAQRGLPISHVAGCDNIPETSSPDGYYVLGLYAHCREAICGSTNMGWFAVRKATGDVFEWGVAEDTLGPRIPVVRR